MLLLLTMNLCMYLSFFLEYPLSFSSLAKSLQSSKQNTVYTSSPLWSLPSMSPSWHSPFSFSDFSCHFVNTSILATYLLHCNYFSTSILHQTFSFSRAGPVSHLSSYYICPAWSLFHSKRSVTLIELMKWNKIDRDLWNYQSCGFRKRPVSFAWYFVINFGWMNE